MRISWPKNRKHNLYLLLMLFLAGMMSCEEYQEGCMDARATNFKVSNQAPCCCEYPHIIFQTTYTDGEKTVPFADTFVNQLGQRYLIRNLRFIATDITLIDSLDEIYKPVDTFQNYLIPPDVLATDVPDLNSTGGNFMLDGSFDRISFSFERIEELETKVPGDFPMDHPFNDSSFYNFSQESWILAHVNIDVVSGNSISLDLPFSGSPVPVSIEGDWTKVKGKDLTVNFRINIPKLVAGMDFSSPHDELLSKFVANLPASFEP